VISNGIGDRLQRRRKCQDQAGSRKVQGKRQERGEELTGHVRPCPDGACEILVERVVWCRWGSGDFLLEIERRFRDERESGLTSQPISGAGSRESALGNFQFRQTSFLPTSRVFTLRLTSSFDTHCLAVPCQLLRHYTPAHHVGQVDSVCIRARCRRRREFSGFPFSNTLFAVLPLSTATR
jgi:hypothetical protein